MKNLIHGVGINDADYILRTLVGGVLIRCPYYQRWASMLMRCYSDNYKSKFPTYEGCTVCDDWLTFSNFRSWMITQDWEGNQLDKDILIPGNKIYSPETCVFVTQKLNSLILDHASSRGDLPLGVTKFRSAYKSQVKKSGSHVNIGVFKTPEAAHIAWRKAKSKIIMESAITQQDNRVFISLVKRARELLTSPHQFV